MDSSVAMLRKTGLDVGTTGTRQVSVGLLWGAAREVDGDPPARANASVPSDLCTFRRLSVPPAGREVRRRVLREELSFSLPFPLEEAAWDWTEQGGQAWVVVAPLDRLERLRRDVGDQASLDAEPLTYLRAALAAGVQSALVIDLGASRTTFCGIQDGQLEWVRVLMRGGISLTALLASKRNLTHTDAEKQKRERGLELAECRQMVDELLEEAFLPAPLPYEHVLLCGGGAAMAGLNSLLKAKLGVEPQLFPLPDSLSPYEHVPAYGAALAVRPNQPRVRLQEPRVSARSSPVTLGRAWIAACVLLALLVADLETRHRLLLGQRTQARQAFATTMRGLGTNPKDNPEQQITQLQARLTTARKDRQLSPEALAEVVASLKEPLGSQALLRRIQLDSGKFQLEGQADSIQAADEVRQNLSKVFEAVEMPRTENLSSGKVRFMIEGKVRE